MPTLDTTFLAESTGQKVECIKQISCSKEQIDDIDDLSTCVSVEKIDLSHNEIDDAHGLGRCHNVTWINLSHNKLQSLAFVKKMKKLSVLNGGYNQIEDTTPVSKLKELKALILNNNSISEVKGLDHLVALNTLVLSYNTIEEIDVSCLPSLVKLQLSHNLISSFPNIQSNEQLKHLLLNDNRIKVVPADCLGHNRLESVNLGRNKIRKFKSVQALTSVPTIKQLNLAGNELCNKDGYVSKILSLFPQAALLDSKPVSLHNASDAKEEIGSLKTKQICRKKKRQTDTDDEVQPKKMKIQSESESVDLKKHQQKKRYAQFVSDTMDKPSTNNKDTNLTFIIDRNPDDLRTPSKEKHVEQDKIYQGKDKTKLHKDEKLKKTEKAAEKQSGVVSIKEVKKKKKKQSVTDLFGLSHEDIGSGSGSTW